MKHLLIAISILISAGCAQTMQQAVVNSSAPTGGGHAAIVNMGGTATSLDALNLSLGAAIAGCSSFKTNLYGSSTGFSPTVNHIYTAWDSPASARWGIAVFTDGSGVGVVDTSGTAVTWDSGTQFFTSGATWPGSAIVINGTTYTISTVNSATSITLTTSAGTQTSVPYSVNTPGTLVAGTSIATAPPNNDNWNEQTPSGIGTLSPGTKYFVCAITNSATQNFGYNDWSDGAGGGNTCSDGGFSLQSVSALGGGTFTTWPATFPASQLIQSAYIYASRSMSNWLTRATTTLTSSRSGAHKRMGSVIQKLS